MHPTFVEHPVLNSPYAYPARHWEQDADGQPTKALIESRRRSDLITPVPKADAADIAVAHACRDETAVDFDTFRSLLAPGRAP